MFSFLSIPLTRGLCCLQMYRVHGDDAENEKEKQKQQQNGLEEKVFPEKHLRVILRSHRNFYSHIRLSHRLSFTPLTRPDGLRVCSKMLRVAKRLKHHIDQRLTVLKVKRTKKGVPAIQKEDVTRKILIRLIEKET